jgi:hypothetical protein
MIQNLESLPIESLNAITPRSMKLYLMSIGWVSIADNPTSVAVFTPPSNDKVQIQIPNIAGTKAYPLMLEDAIKTISKIEGALTNEILGDVPYLAASDILKIRRISEETVDGSIPFIDGVELINSAKGMLVATACSRFSRKQFHARLWCAKADEFIKKCKIGQTERGSFVLRVICPTGVPDRIGQNSLDDFTYVTSDIPKTETRFITSELMRSVDFVIKSIRNVDNYNINRIINKEDGDPVISANFCDAVSILEPEGDAETVDLSMKWAGGVKPSNGVPNTITLVNSDFPKLSEVANSLRPPSEAKIGEFVGKIESITEIDDSIDITEAISEFVLTFEYNDRLIKAKVQFSGNERKFAYESSQRRNHVRVIGGLRKDRRTYYIDDATIGGINKLD